MSPDAVQVRGRVVAVGVVTLMLVIGSGRAEMCRIQHSTHYYHRTHYSQLTVSVLVCVTVRLPVRYGEKKLEVHLYSPASSRLSGLNVRVGLREYSLMPSLFHRRELKLTASRSSPLTSHIKE